MLPVSTLQHTHTALLLDAWRQLRRLGLQWQLARERHRAVRDALRVALELVAEQNRTLDRLRSTNQALREENRRYIRVRVEERAA